MFEPCQQSMFDNDALRERDTTVRDGSAVLSDHRRLRELRAVATTRRQFCIFAGLEPGPITYARVNAALIAAGLEPYSAVRRAA